MYFVNRFLICGIKGGRRQTESCMCSGEVNVEFGKASQSQGLCGATHYSIARLASYCPV